MASKTSYTPTELATELKVDAKRIRAYLRSNFTRPAEAKNTSWSLDANVAKDVREHFAPKTKASDTKES